MGDETIPSDGVIIRAENGDVIRYDETGLILRLSDQVIADIAARLDLKPTGLAPAEAEVPDLPEDIDLWAARRVGDWVHFQANLPGADMCAGLSAACRRRRDHCRGAGAIAGDPGHRRGARGSWSARSGTVPLACAGPGG